MLHEQACQAPDEPGAMPVALLYHVSHISSINARLSFRSWSDLGQLWHTMCVSTSA